MKLAESIPDRTVGKRLLRECLVKYFVSLATLRASRCYVNVIHIARQNFSHKLRFFIFRDFTRGEPLLVMSRS